MRSRPFKRALGRLDVVYAESPVYFITFCTQRRRKFLATQKMHQAFRKFALAAAERAMLVGRYVLMPDHIHFFLATICDKETLSMWVKSLKNALSKELRGAGFRAPHWQRGFFDHVVRREESHASKWDYVRQNPVRAGLVERPEDWPFQGEIHAL